MAQLLFEALAGGLSNIDHQSVLSAFLESQTAVSNDTEPPSLDDDDVFLCGKCKKQFTSLPQFMTHKKEHCGALNSSVSLANNAVVVKSNNNVGSPPMIAFMPSTRSTNLPAQLQVPPSPLGTLSGGNILLTEADLLALTANFDQLTSTTVTSSLSNQQNNQPQSTVQDTSNSSNKGTSHLDGISMITTSNNSTNQQANMGLSILTNALVNSSLLVTNQQTNPNCSVASSMSTTQNQTSNTMQNMIVTIASQPKLSRLQEEMLLSRIENGVKVSDHVHDSIANADNLDIRTTECSEIEITAECDSIKAVEQLGNTGLQTENVSEVQSTSAKLSKLKCTYCEKVFNKNFDLQQHIRCHTGEKPFQCVVCGRAFAQKSNVKKHLQTHKVWPDGLANTLPRQPQKEDSNNSENNSQSSNQESLEPVENSNTFKLDNLYMCPYCKFAGKTYCLLKSHMKQHKVEKLYKCILVKCGKLYGELDSFLDHVRSHENEMLYQCHICSKNFNSLYDLGAHQYAHSLYPNQGRKTGSKTYRCTRCLNKYSTEAALLHHMNTSTHNYKCMHCDKEFTCERYLRRHLNTHNSENKHICVACGKGFKTENYLRIHYTTHSTERPFKCTSCEAAFNRRDKLKRHMLVHDPIKRLKCPFRNYTGCEKEFNRPDKLKAHILTHSDYKPFKCRLCPRMFNRKALLKQHETQRHSDRTFKCVRCAVSFETEENLTRHVCSPAALKRTRATSRYLRAARGKRQRLKATLASDQTPKKIGRPRKSTAKTIAAPAEITNILNDGIPTAHIEIITTDDSMATQNCITQLKISPYPVVQIVDTSKVDDNGSLQLLKDFTTNSVIHVIDDEQLSSLSVVKGDNLSHHEDILGNITTSTAQSSLLSHEVEACKDLENIVLTVNSSAIS